MHWKRDSLQGNSKHSALPCAGEVRAGERRYRLDPQSAFAVQDWGRGMWPYRAFWNWGVATGYAGDQLLGVNFGAKWTGGTGSNENGILLDGRPPSEYISSKQGIVLEELIYLSSLSRWEPNKT